MSSSPDVAIIGGGVAGLTAAALLAHAGARVTVYEQHNVPGGCASFYQRDGYRFDVGATVVNGFGPRGIHTRIFDHLGIALPATRLEPAMLVHLPDATIARYGDARWERERIDAFGPEYERFWKRQEAIADRVWDLSARMPCLPADLPSIAHLASIFRPVHLPLLALQGRTLASILPRDASSRMRAFVDLQLLITAQSSAEQADLAFGCTALDIAREGTYHLAGGIADIAIALARSIRRDGGTIRYNTAVRRIHARDTRIDGIELADGTVARAAHVVSALPIENVWELLETTPTPDRRVQHFSAVTAYVGLPPGSVADDCVLHHQVLASYDEPLGEANSAFVSISAQDDRTRARNGGRAVTISTHTDPALWERAYRSGRYEALKRAYEERLLRALERVVGPVNPSLIEIGTPMSFERYTGRSRGMVGGVPQYASTASLRARSHRLAGYRNLTLCGDTVFPGQSTVGVSLSAVNAVRALVPDALSTRSRPRSFA